MLFSITKDYLKWHYGRAFSEIFHVWLNLLWFIVYFFSLPQLLQSWFYPWKRITEEKPAMWSFEAFAGVIIIGLISRTIGFLVRSIFISLGLLALFSTIALGFLTYLLWIFLPFLVIGLFVLGIFIIAK